MGVIVGLGYYCADEGTDIKLINCISFISHIRKRWRGGEEVVGRSVIAALLRGKV